MVLLLYSCRLTYSKFDALDLQIEIPLSSVSRTLLISVDSAVLRTLKPGCDDIRGVDSGITPPSLYGLH